MLINRRKIQTLLWIILITAFSAIPILSQTETPKINTVAVSRKIQPVTTGGSETTGVRQTDCETELATANQRLLKTLDSLDFAEKAIEAQKAEIAALKSLVEINKQIEAKKDSVIENQNILIEKLTKQARPEFKAFWGLIKIRF